MSLSPLRDENPKTEHVNVTKGLTTLIHSTSGRTWYPTPPEIQVTRQIKIHPGDDDGGNFRIHYGRCRFQVRYGIKVAHHNNVITRTMTKDRRALRGCCGRTKSGPVRSRAPHQRQNNVTRTGTTSRWKNGNVCCWKLGSVTWKTGEKRWNQSEHRAKMASPPMKRRAIKRNRRGLQERKIMGKIRDIIN